VITMRVTPFRTVLSQEQPARVEAVMAAEAAIKASIVHSVTTDFDGKAVLTGIAPGTYWLFGCYSDVRGERAWHVPVVVTRARTTSVVLDQGNATRR
jgi:hypothetical protein